MNGERMMTSSDKNHRRKLHAEAKEEQFRVMLVEKAIWTGVIRDVNISAYNIVMPRLKKKMTKNSIVRPGPRDWERVKIFSRLMAIVTAIERVWNLPGGEHYGMQFTADMIPSIEAHLCVTEEMVIFTLSLLSDQFRSPIEHKILNTIWTMEEKSNPTFGSPTAGAVNEERSWNYLKLPKMHLLTKQINSRIPLSKGRPSSNNIQNFLQNMCKHSVKSHKYKQGATANGFPIEDTTGASQFYQSCVSTQDGVFIHVSHLLAHKEDNADNMFQILRSETHQHSTNKRMLTACPYSSNHFHVFKVIDRSPGGGELKYDNILANSATSRWITETPDDAAASRTRDGYRIKYDIDTHVAKEWSKTIGKKTYTPQDTVDRIMAVDIAFRPEMTYPQTLVNSMPSTKRTREPDVQQAVKKRKSSLH